MKKYLFILFILISNNIFGSITFRNPVIWADVPDPDVIRVEDYYYMVSTTMHLMPGGPIMRSKDLVHWETVSYLFDKLTDSPKYDMTNGTVYGRGQWATSLKYNNGKFYALFAPNDSQGRKSYLYTTEDPTKGWTLLSRFQHFHDSSLFFDDDGRVYVFYSTGQLSELKADLSGVKNGRINIDLGVRDSSETGLLEGSRVIKHDGKYYLLMISWPSGRPRRQVCYRADKIEGPYTKKVILQSKLDGFPYAGQGTIVEGKDGKWYGMIFQDRGGVGRVLTLMPCRWIDGWPILGDEDGKIPETMTVDGDDNTEYSIVKSDDFDKDKLDVCWQWNHNPIDASWSLTKRKGYLRLATSRLSESIFDAPNTISQRMEGPQCSAVVTLDLSKMKQGDKTGFAALNGNSGLMCVERTKDGTYLAMQTSVVALDEHDKKITSVETKDIERVKIKTKKIFLKIEGDFRLNRDIATFYYSLDGKEWQKIGNDFKMIYDYRRLFMGTRFAIFNYSTETVGGYVDVDYFHYSRSDK